MHRPFPYSVTDIGSLGALDLTRMTLIQAVSVVIPKAGVGFEAKGLSLPGTVDCQEFLTS